MWKKTANYRIYRLIVFSQRHAPLVLISIGIVSIVLACFAVRIELDPEINDLIPRDSEVIQRIEKYGGKMAGQDYVLLAVEGNPLFELEKLQAYDHAIRRIEALPEVHSSINPFNLITFRKDGKKLELLPMSTGGRAPRTEEELDLFRRRLLRDDQAENLVISKDRSVLCAFFVIDIQEDYSPLYENVNSIAADLEPYYKTHIGGLVFFEQLSRHYLVKDVPRFVYLCLAVILLIFFAGFGSVRGVVLPLSVVGLGTLWTIGTMSLLGLKVTPISIMTPPLVLTLGSSYSIHILNQYYREAVTENGDVRWIARAMVHINKTVLMAALTTMIGFGSLLSATLEQVRTFGLATSLGILYCALLSLFFFPAVLSRLSSPRSQQKRRVDGGALTRLMEELASFVLRRRIVILALLGIIAGIFSLSVWKVRFRSDYTTYFRHRERVVEDNLFITRKFGSFIYVYINLSAPDGREGYFAKPAVLKQIAAFEDHLRENPDVSYISSFSSYLRAMNRTMTGSYTIPERRAMISLLSRYWKVLAASEEGQVMTDSFINDELTRFTISLRVYDSEGETFVFEDTLKELIGEIEEQMDRLLDPELNPEFWGATFATLSLSETLTRDLLWSVFASFLLILAISSLAFQSFKFGLLTLVPLVTGVMLNFIAMSLFKIPLDVVTVTVSCVAIGVGVDDSIHLLIQFRRQRRRVSGGMGSILARTLKFSGRPILLTSFSLIAGLCVLTLSSFMPVAYFGLLVSLAILTTTFGALVVLPALLSWQKGGLRVEAVAHGEQDSTTAGQTAEEFRSRRGA